MVDDETRVLILGSLPGEVSLARAQYYANPRNQFWRLLAAVSGRDMPDDYDARLRVLRTLHIGLWDVVGSAERTGSLDGSIRKATANPLGELAASLPRLKAVAFNGGRAATMGAAALADHPDLVLLSLPSSSPAYTLAYELKLARWRTLSPFLSDSG